MSVPGPSLGPCTSWVTAEEIAACCPIALGSDNTDVFDLAADEASMVLFEVSGRQFPGLCPPVTVRPCRQPCGCWGGEAIGLGQWFWGSGVGGFGWGWRNECGDKCGCGVLSRVKLAGYPVREITEVLIDGAVVDPTSYRLDNWKWLTRLDDPGPPVSRRVWPSCQNLALNDDQPGTFSVSYRYGADPPAAAVRAAAQLGCQIVASCAGGAGAVCLLPQGATKVVRQGVTIERRFLLDFVASGKTGILGVDLFVQAYGGIGRRRPAVWSPDIQKFARPVGT